MAIAGSPRNIFRYSLDQLWIREVEILKRVEGRKTTHFYQTPNARIFDQESVLRSNFVVQKGNNPDHRIRSLIFAKWARK